MPIVMANILIPITLAVILLRLPLKCWFVKAAFVEAKMIVVNHALWI